MTSYSRTGKTFLPFKRQLSLSFQLRINCLKFKFIAFTKKVAITFFLKSADGTQDFKSAFKLDSGRHFCEFFSDKKILANQIVVFSVLELAYEIEPAQRWIVEKFLIEKNVHNILPINLRIILCQMKANCLKILFRNGLSWPVS